MRLTTGATKTVGVHGERTSMPRTIVIVAAAMVTRVFWSRAPRRPDQVGLSGGHTQGVVVHVRVREHGMWP